MAKRYLEKRMLQASRKLKFDLTIIRPFNIYGERYKWQGKYSQYIPMLVNKVIKTKRTLKYGVQATNKEIIYMLKIVLKLCIKFLKKYTKTPVNIGYEENNKNERFGSQNI